MRFDTLGLIAYLGAMAIGVGGALGAVALGQPDLAYAVLTGVTGLLVPAPRLLKPVEGQ